MTFFKGFTGLLLLILASLKVIFMISLLVQGDSERPTMWFVKQSVYAVAFAVVGFGWVRSDPETDVHSDDE